MDVLQISLTHFDKIVIRATPHSIWVTGSSELNKALNLDIRNSGQEKAGSEMALLFF